MRELKFRAWDKVKKEFVISLTIQEFFEATVRVMRFPNRDLIWQQHTGLKDKNDKEIYGGDIIKIKKYPHLFSDIYEEHFGFPIIADVFWSAGRYAIHFVGEPETFQDLDILITHQDDTKLSCEVIGNIFENPELLKGVN